MKERKPLFRSGDRVIVDGSAIDFINGMPATVISTYPKLGLVVIEFEKLRNRDIAKEWELVLNPGKLPPRNLVRHKVYESILCNNREPVVTHDLLKQIIKERL